MRRNLRLYLTFVFILLLAAFSAWMVAPKGSKIDLRKAKINYNKEFKTRLGLDLQGGTHLEYRGILDDIPQEQRKQAMESARTAIERRIFFIGGVQEPLVITSGEERVIVELPGVSNIDEAKKIIGQTPFLEFREQVSDTPVASVDENGVATVDVDSMYKPTGLTGKDLKTATVELDQFGQPQISLQFNSEGAQKFAEITQRNLGKPIAIFLDGQMLSAPTVQNAITDGLAIITGQFTREEARGIATNLNSGALPVKIEPISQQNVGATLGKDSIHKSMIAAVIGIIMIALFMILYYRLPGLLAVLALAIYVMLSLAIFKIGISVAALFLVGIFFLLAITTSWVFGVLAILSYVGLMFLGGLNPVTVTLAGIAGFILSIGMAVDANILIFERTKEELRAGKDVTKSLEDGFSRAWLSIRDSNVSSLITIFILYFFGTPSIKSFALALGIGILISMFTAITVTRTFLRMFIGHNILAHPWLFGGRKINAEEKNNA